LVVAKREEKQKGEETDRTGREEGRVRRGETGSSVRLCPHVSSCRTPQYKGEKNTALLRTRAQGENASSPGSHAKKCE